MNHNLAERKRELVARSEHYRTALRQDLYSIQAQVAWIPRTLQMLRMVAPALTVAAPLLGLLLGRRIRGKAAETAAPRKGLFAKVLTGIAVYRKVKSVVDNFREIQGRFAQSR